ncbi:MAG: radical SAM family heme chaperone HemW [Eubacteriaceae bacterium]
MKSIGIYCHIPFCIKKCIYCDFPSFSQWDESCVNHYFKNLIEEIILCSEEGEKRQREHWVDTLYFGGGTPSAIHEKYIGEILTLIRERFRVLPEAEITIEINPGTLTLEKAKAYFDAGINRVSMGLQAWQDRLLLEIGRIHTQRDFVKSMEVLKEVGFNNISVDVMYGLPNQTLEDVRETLNEIMSFNPTHLSCYSLILEEGTPLSLLESKGEVVLPEDDHERKMHWEINDFLGAQGYLHYEISSYAKPGFESKHNLKYWEGVPYLGFGAGAHGYINGERYGNPDNLLEYKQLIKNKFEGRLMEKLSEEQIKEEWVFLGLRKLEGINAMIFKEKFGKDFFEEYKNVINPLIEKGLLEKKGDWLKLTREGQNFGNQVFMAFL